MWLTFILFVNLILYSRGSQPGVHVPPGVHIEILGGTFCAVIDAHEFCHYIKNYNNTGYYSFTFSINSINTLTEASEGILCYTKSDKFKPAAAIKLED